MGKKETPFGVRIAKIAENICKSVEKQVDMEKLEKDRNYIDDMQEGWLKTLLYEKAKGESLITQIYFQFSPEVTPQLSPDEFGAGVCLENIGNWEISEHNMSYIRDFLDENGFLKWWYFESVRINEGGFTRVYFDPYLKKKVITYSIAVYRCKEQGNSTLIGVLGIDIPYNDFKKAMNNKLISNIKSDMESVREDFATMGKKEIFEEQLMDVNTFKMIGREKSLSETVTKSPDMEKVMALSLKAALSDANVLLQGETGVGKDFWANFIHVNSQFKKGKLVNVNCCALPESLIESEFFGYGKGAFTGAKGEGKAGYFEVANNGTIILNEIGDLPIHMQAKLLNVIQEKAFVRVGETVPIKTNFRLIAATNKDLLQLVKAGLFREDLYYRLNVIPIFIPPIREREEDIVYLIDYFMEQNIEKYQKDKKISLRLLEILKSYSWPGNIRELENVIERLFVMSNSNELDEEDLPEEFIKKIYDETNDKKEKKVELSRKIDFKEDTLKEIMEELEKEIILSAYQELKSSYKVAERLGISQSQATQKIKKYGK